MKRSTSEFTLMASLVLAIAVSAPAQAQDDSANQQMINMVLQIQQLQDEIRMLRGQLEEQAFELEKIQRRQRDQYLDLDQRISELRDDTLVMTGTPQITGGGAAATTVTPREDVPEVRPATESQSTVTGRAAPQSEARTQQATPEMEQTAYDQAFQALKELRYADAAEGFQDFLDRYPQSEYADNAQYWLGESYYVTRNYEMALEAFQNLMKDFPGSRKLGDGLLKIGYTHYELKQWDQARAALEQVQQQYPDSTLARLAESRLRSMRLEGHY